MCSCCLVEAQFHWLEEDGQLWSLLEPRPVKDSLQRLVFGKLTEGKGLGKCILVTELRLRSLHVLS